MDVIFKFISCNFLIRDFYLDNSFSFLLGTTSDYFFICVEHRKQLEDRSACSAKNQLSIRKLQGGVLPPV